MNSALLTKHVKDSYCSYCGCIFTNQKSWPRRCFICWNDSYKNPVPAVVSMIKVVMDNSKYGLLIQQRNIEPHQGEWALPSGYLECGESWEEAAVRENKEEMGIESKPENYALYGIKNSSTKDIILIFTYTKNYLFTEQEAKYIINNFIPNEEVSAIKIYTGDILLAFESHNEYAIELLK